METIKHAPTGSQPDRPGVSYDERRDISLYNVERIKKMDKEDAVHYARAGGLLETGMSVNEIGLLYDLLEKKGACNIVELGRNFACSTRIFLQHVVRHGGRLESWDLKHWGDIKGTWERQGFGVSTPVNSRHPEDYCIFRDPSLAGGALAEIRIAHSIKTSIEDESRWVDFLLIDTEHGLEHALGEYMRWREYLRGGALVAFHDSTLPGPARAIEIAKEVEDMATGGHRIVAQHENENVDGYGITVLEWRG